MSEFFIRVATPADVDRLWPLFDEVENERMTVTDGAEIRLAESRRSALVSLLLDQERPVLVAYSGIRAVGYAFGATDETPFVSESWRGLGVDAELQDARMASR